MANALVPNTLTREQAQLYSYPSTKDGFTIDHVHAVYLKLTAGSGMPLKDRNEGAANSLRQSIFNSIEKAGAETEPMGIVESAVKKFIADRNLVAEKCLQASRGESVSLMDSAEARDLLSEGLQKQLTNTSGRIGEHGINRDMYVDLNRSAYQFGEMSFSTTGHLDEKLDAFKSHFADGETLNQDALEKTSMLAHQGLIGNLFDTYMQTVTLKTGKLPPSDPNTHTPAKYVVTRTENGDVDITASKYMNWNPQAEGRIEDMNFSEWSINITLKKSTTEGEYSTVVLNSATYTE